MLKREKINKSNKLNKFTNYPCKDPEQLWI